MFNITIKVKFEYAHRLLKHHGKCFHLHGHSGEAALTYESEHLDKNDFVVDFETVKTPIKEFVNDIFDHAALLNINDPLMESIRELGLKYAIFEEDPTAEIIARTLYDVAHAHLLKRNLTSVKIKQVSMQETCTGSATYTGD